MNNTQIYEFKNEMSRGAYYEYSASIAELSGYYLDAKNSYYHAALHYRNAENIAEAAGDYRRYSAGDKATYCEEKKQDMSYKYDDLVSQQNNELKL